MNNYFFVACLLVVVLVFVFLSSALLGIYSWLISFFMLVVGITSVYLFRLGINQNQMEVK